MAITDIPQDNVLPFRNGDGSAPPVYRTDDLDHWLCTVFPIITLLRGTARGKADIYLSARSWLTDELKAAIARVEHELTNIAPVPGTTADPHSAFMLNLYLERVAAAITLLDHTSEDDDLADFRVHLAAQLDCDFRYVNAIAETWQNLHSEGGTA